MVVYDAYKHSVLNPSNRLRAHHTNSLVQL